MESHQLEELINTSKELFHSKNYKKAISGFKVAHKHFQDIGDDLNSAEMANNLCVALLLDGKKKEALSIVEGTDIIFQNHNDSLKQAMALGNKASALEALSKFDEAMDVYQRSAELLESIGDTEYLPQILKSLSMIQLRRGKQFESLVSMQQSLDKKNKRSLKDRFMKFLLKIPFKFSR